MKRIRYVLLSLVFALLAAGAFVPQVSAAEITAEQIIPCENLGNGVAVMDDGTICAAGGRSVSGFNAAGEEVFSIGLPAKCGNLCSWGDYLFASGYNAMNLNNIYVMKPGEWESYKTLDAGQRAQAVTVDYNGYLYCVNSSRTDAYGKKATKILRAKVSDIVSLQDEGTINWTKEYQPDYKAPASDKNCYPQGIAVDGRGNIYIADRGASEGANGSVTGIYRYEPASGSVTPMYFTGGNVHRVFTWVYDVCADDYGTVAVAGRVNNEIAIFRPGSTVADALIEGGGFPQGVGRDKEGNIYFNATGQSITNNKGIYKIDMGHVPVTGVDLSAHSKSIAVGKSLTLSPVISPSNATNQDVLYTSSNTSVASVSASGKVTGKKVGKATITVKTVQGRKTTSCAVTVNKAANPMTVKPRTATVKYSKVKKKTQTLKRSAVLTISKKQGTLSFKKMTGNKKITISKSSGKVTVKKGLKKGTYKVKVQVKAAGNSNYKALTKTVTFKVRVK